MFVVLLVLFVFVPVEFYLDIWLEFERTNESFKELVWAEVVGGVLEPLYSSICKSEEVLGYFLNNGYPITFLLCSVSPSNPVGFLSFLNSSTLAISPSNTIFF